MTAVTRTISPFENWLGRSVSVIAILRQLLFARDLHSFVNPLLMAFLLHRPWFLSKRLNYLLSSSSPGCQVLSNHGSRGPYSRKITHQPFPGTVCTQLPALPAGAVGPKYTSYEPSGFFSMSGLLLPRLGKRESVCNSERVCMS